MYRDPSEFRERFKAYKEGKSVREIYGLPGYAPGKVGEPSPDEVFVESMGPLLYRELLYQGVQNPDVVYKNLIAQLAYESDRGRSRVAREQHNYGGVGWNGKTYFNYKNDADFVHDYVKLMNRRYKTAIQADTLYDYAKGIKKLGYFEDTLENYSRNLIGMKSLHKAALAHKMANPELYKVEKIPTQQTSPIVAAPVSTKVATTIPQEKTIPIIDPRNATIAEAQRAMWAHTAFENMPKVSDMPIWESPSLPALTPVDYDVTPLKTYAGGKAAGEDEPVITQGRAGSRLERFRRSMDPDENDGTAVRVLKGVGRGVADIALDLTKASGIETLNRFATETQRPEDYIDAAFLTVGGAIISKMSKVSPIYMKPFIKSFDDMDAKAIGKYFFQEHPELINKPQEAWYGELAKKSDDYFKQAIERRVRLFDKAGKPLSPESIAAQVSPDLKVASMPGSKYGGVYSPADNTMLINNDRVKDPRTALRVYNHEKAHAMQTAFEDATGLPYPATYGAEMEGLFRYTPEYKAAHKGVHLGLETDASLHEGKSLAAYDKDVLGNLLDIDFKNMTDEEFYKYMHNGYFKNLKLSIPEGAKKQKEFVGKLKDGKLPEYNNGKISIKPENRGKFNATKKRTGKTTEELTHSKNPLTRKRAIFAQNARKWHHADGKLPGYENGVFPWGEDDTKEKTEQWADDWASRVTTSRVLKEWNKTGIKPKAESLDEYTKRRVKEETKRTWLSDAADISHGVGEAMLSIDPYTAIPYFGAKIGNDAVNGNIGMHTALDATGMMGSWLFNYVNPNSLLNQNIRTALYNNKIPYSYNLLDINIPKSYIEGSIEALRGNKIQQLAKPNWFNKSGNILGSTGEASARPLTEMHQNHRAAAWARYLGLDDTLQGVGYIPSREGWVTKVKDPYFENAYRAQIYEKLQKGQSSLKGTISDKSVYNTAGGMGYEINPSNGVVRIFDVWDLQPFKTLNIPFLKNFEASQILPGAKPFNFETFTSIPR